MEYVFGNEEEREILKTKGTEHTNLDGYHSLERKYDDQYITDNFRIVGTIDSKEDEEGNCYDWYDIDHHYRYADKFTQGIVKTEQEISDNEDGIAELGESESDNSDAIAELGTMVSDLEARVAALEGGN